MSLKLCPVNEVVQGSDDDGQLLSGRWCVKTMGIVQLKDLFSDPTLQALSKLQQQSSRHGRFYRYGRDKLHFLRWLWIYQLFTL